MTPTLLHTGLQSPITEFALPLLASRQGAFFPSGTAIVVAPYLAITARHVIEDYWRKSEGQPLLGNGERSGSFSLQAFQVLEEGNRGALWDVKRMWLSPHSDIAFLRLDPRSALAASHTWRCPRIDLLPPAVGSRVAAFGYHSSAIKVEETESSIQLEWKDEPTTSRGTVKMIHEAKCDAGLLRFPCFETDARFEGGMSGGPVFNEMGELCGIVCASLAVSVDDNEYFSHVATLWPMMGTLIDMPRKGVDFDGHYPVLDLARGGFITAKGWEKVILNRDTTGHVKQVGLRVGSGS